MFEVKGYVTIEQQNSDDIAQPWDLVTYDRSSPTDVKRATTWIIHMIRKEEPYAIIRKNDTCILIVEYTADEHIDGTPYEIPPFIKLANGE